MNGVVEDETDAEDEKSGCVEFFGHVVGRDAKGNVAEEVAALGVCEVVGLCGHGGIRWDLKSFLDDGCEM